MSAALSMVCADASQQGQVAFSCPPLLASHGVAHVFTARRHQAMASGDPEGGNVALSGQRDRAAAVATRRRWLTTLGAEPERLVVGGQTHSCTVALVGAAQAGRGADSPHTVLPETDGLFTTTVDLPLYLAVADCGGLLLTAKQGKRRALALIHAGWRGLAGGIVAVAVGRFLDHGFAAADIHAWIAPCIRAPSYEVGPEVALAAPATVRFPGQGDRWQLDIADWCAEALLAAGLKADKLFLAGLDTGQDERLFSHRRQGIKAGRNGLFAQLRAD